MKPVKIVGRIPKGKAEPRTNNVKLQDVQRTMNPNIWMYDNAIKRSMSGYDDDQNPQGTSDNINELNKPLCNATNLFTDGQAHDMGMST